MLRLRQDIPLFYGGKRKAFTLSYDDGVSQDLRLAALFRKYGLKGTFNLNTGLMGRKDWLVQPGIDVSHYKLGMEEAAGAYAGFELAVHTMTHPDLTKIPDSMAVYEVVENKKELEELARRPVRGMAYPFGTYNSRLAETLRHCGIAYARTTRSTYQFDLPEDFLMWHPTCHHTEECLDTLAADFLGQLSPGAYQKPKLFYVWGHSYEFDAYGQWEMMESFIRKIAGHEDIWYATNGEIQAYMEAVKRLIYSATGDYIENPSARDVWMQIDGKTYCVRGGETVIIETPE